MTSRSIGRLPALSGEGGRRFDLAPDGVEWGLVATVFEAEGDYQFPQAVVLGHYIIPDGDDGAVDESAYSYAPDAGSAEQAEETTAAL